MTEFFCIKVKTRTGLALVPAHQTDEDALKKMPNAIPLRVKVTRMRNVDHHRKYFALLNYAFDCWEPKVLVTEARKAVRYNPEKNFDRFRRDIVILSGFYDAHYRLNGEIRLEPKSISFSNMEQDDFDILYGKTIDVIIKHVLTNYSGDQLRQVIDQIQEFE